jgi:hypothetical protein
MHADFFARLVRNTAEPINDQACWLWTASHSKRYPRMCVRVNGKNFTIKPHRAMLVILEVGAEHHLFWPLYELYSIAEFEADHHCFNSPMCINPDHLQWLTEEENSAKRWIKHPDQRKPP